MRRGVFAETDRVRNYNMKNESKVFLYTIRISKCELIIGHSIPTYSQVRSHPIATSHDNSRYI